MDQGRALEELVCYMFERVPGVSVTARTRLNVFESEEIDVALWNEGRSQGFYFLPNIILCESKSWSQPVGSIHVNWFDTKIRNRGQSIGVFVALNGVTGEAQDLTAAHHVVANALREGRQIVVITRGDVERFRQSTDIVRLMKKKLCDLAVTGTTLE